MSDMKKDATPTTSAQIGALYEQVFGPGSYIEAADVAMKNEEKMGLPSTTQKSSVSFGDNNVEVPKDDDLSM